MPLSIIYEGSRTEVALELDALTSERHTGEVDLPSHPVEEGLEVTDDVQEKPVEYEVTGIVTNTPREIDGDGAARQAQIFDTLEELALAGELVTVATLNRTYVGMRLRRFTCDRDAAKSAQLRVALSFRRIRVVASQVVAILTGAGPGRTKPKLDDGKQVASPASAGVTQKVNKSAAAQLFDGDIKLNPFAD